MDRRPGAVDHRRRAITLLYSTMCHTLSTSSSTIESSVCPNTFVEYLRESLPQTYGIDRHLQSSSERDRADDFLRVNILRAISLDLDHCQSWGFLYESEDELSEADLDSTDVFDQQALMRNIFKGILVIGVTVAVLLAVCILVIKEQPPRRKKFNAASPGLDSCAGESEELLTSDIHREITQKAFAKQQNRRCELYENTFRGNGPLPASMQLMKVVFENEDSTRTHDVFVHYHWEERVWVHEVLLPRLQGDLGMGVKSENDILFGYSLVQELIECILHCEHLVLTLSQSYVKDALCCDFSVRAYSLRPHAVVPIALPALDIADLEAHIPFSAIIRTNGVLYWSDNEGKQERFWEALEERLNTNSNVEIWRLRERAREACCVLMCNKIRCCGDTYRVQIEVTSVTEI